MYLRTLFSVLLVMFAVFGNAQQATLRNNMAYDATLSPNLGLEVRLDSTWTLGTNVGLNFWDYDKSKNKKWRHLMISPNVRHYNDTLFQRSFWGLHAVYSHYNASNVKFPFGLYKDVRDNRRQGDLVAVGGSFGYNWQLAGRLHFEAELGLAVGYTWFKEYDCATCGIYHGRDSKPLLLPKVGLNLVWNIGRRPVVATPVETAPVVPEPPLLLAVHNVADNTGRAGLLEHDNPVLEHISKYRPYDRTRILRRERGALYVHFPVGKADLDHDFRNNAATLDRIVDITRQITADTTSQVKRIQLIGLASIEGAVSQNEQLAASRADALKRYLQQQVPTADSLYECIGGGEAWAEFRDQLGELSAAGENESTAGLQAALRIIDGEADADRREQQLRQLNGGRTWQYVRDNVLADQRNSGYIRIYYDYVPDAAAAAINCASELLRTDCGDCHRQALELLRGVSADRRAQNALGVALWLTGRKDEALEHFRRAAADGNEDARENLRQLENHMNKINY